MALDTPRKLDSNEKQEIFETFVIKLISLGWSFGAIGDELAVLAQALENLENAEKFDN